MVRILIASLVKEYQACPPVYARTLEVHLPTISLVLIIQAEVPRYMIQDEVFHGQNVMFGIEAEYGKKRGRHEFLWVARRMRSLQSCQSRRVSLFILASSVVVAVSTCGFARERVPH